MTLRIRMAVMCVAAACLFTTSVNADTFFDFVPGTGIPVSTLDIWHEDWHLYGIGQSQLNLEFASMLDMVESSASSTSVDFSLTSDLLTGRETLSILTVHAQMSAGQTAFAGQWMTQYELILLKPDGTPSDSGDGLYFQNVHTDDGYGNINMFTGPLDSVGIAVHERSSWPTTSNSEDVYGFTMDLSLDPSYLGLENTIRFRLSANTIPEPATVSLLAMGLLSLSCGRGPRNSKKTLNGNQ